MKSFCLILFMLFITLSSYSQYTGDPSQPMAVCNALYKQNKVSALPDGSGGYFVFWIDKRVNNINGILYGQHVDPTGVSLWAPNGKIIVQPAVKEVLAYQCILWNGGILVTWKQSELSGYGDSVLCKKIDFSGNDIWAQPTLISQNGSPILYNDNYLETFGTDSGATIVYNVVYFGGSSSISFNRIDNNGVLQWPLNSQTPTLPGYVFFGYPDGQNGFYTLSRGNGLGSGIHIQRFNLQGIAQWPNAIDVSLAVPSNGFGGLHNMMHDADGNLYLVWHSNSNKILVTKIKASGGYAWSPSFKQLVSVTSNQARPYSFIKDHHIYTAWLDDRIPGQSSVYVQKLDTSGNDLWTSDGLYVSQANSNYSYPKLALSDSNSIACVYYEASANFAIQRIRDDESLTWPGFGITFSDFNSIGFTYDDFVLNDDTSGCNVIFWSGGLPDPDIFGAKVCSDGFLFNSIESFEEAGLCVYPNPAHNYLFISYEKKPEAISILDLQGRMVKQISNLPGQNLISMDISNLSKGIYMVEIKYNEARYFVKLLKQ